jgi:hypothetical protein
MTRLPKLSCVDCGAVLPLHRRSAGFCGLCADWHAALAAALAGETYSTPWRPL